MRARLMFPAAPEVKVNLGREWDTYAFPAEREDGAMMDYFRCHFPACLSGTQKIQVLTKVIQDLILSECGGAA